MRTAKSSSKFARYRSCWRFVSQAPGTRSRGPMPDTENGRYALSPAGDGVLRLDTRTGAVSTCNNSGAGWACYAVPDERAAMDAEIGRLQRQTGSRPTMKSSRQNSPRASPPWPARSKSRCRNRTR